MSEDTVLLNEFSAYRPLPALSELFRQAMLDATTEALVAVNVAGMVVLANKKGREALNFTLGATLEDKLPDFWRRQVDPVLKAAEQPQVESVDIGGTPYEVAVVAVRDQGQVVGAVCIFSTRPDLDEMVNQMRAYQDLTHELDAIIDSSSNGLWVCDADATVIRINRASERINNITAEAVVGRNMKDLVEQGFVDRSVTLQVLQTGKEVSLLQQREGRKLILTGTPVFDGKGQLIRVVTSERDITELDKLQRELEEHAALEDKFRTQMVEMQQAELESRQIIARSPCMIKAFQQALKVSKADSSVLILGESGVGKGLFADLIHQNSQRADNPLIKINCGAIPESLIESELFGYEKGAFTGANSSKAGYFELANGGILFLDEIAELPLPSQVKLLRFLEDGRIMRLGGTQARTVDVRILAATHRNLEEMVEEGQFRLDLYYRLNVIPLSVPSLRDRRDCILPLIRHYIEKFCAQIGIRKRLTRAASDALLAYAYPGNVRELMNICERLVVMSEMELIDLADLPKQIVEQVDEGGVPVEVWSEETTLTELVERIERDYLMRVAKKHRSQTRIAQAAGVSQSTIQRKLKKYGIE